MVGPEGRWLWTLYGTLGGVYIDSYMAELKAILEAMRVALPPLRIHTDNAELLLAESRGKAWCTSARRRGAALWREIWRYREELG